MIRIQVPKTIKIKKYNSFSELLFFFAYILIVVSSILSLTFYSRYLPDSLMKVVAVTAGSLIFAGELRKTVNEKLLVYILFAAAAVYITMHNTDGFFHGSLIFTILLIYSGRDIDFRKIAKVSLYVHIGVLIFVVFSAKTGIISNYILVSTGRKRDFLGFLYTLYPATIMLNIVALEIYLKRKNISYFHLILLFLASYWIFYSTDARLAFYSNCVLIFYALLIKATNGKFERARGVYLCMVPAYPVCFAISVGFSYAYKPSMKWLAKINDFLGNRLQLGRNSLHTYGVSLFGKRISWIGNSVNAYGFASTKEYNYVDSMYIQLLQRYGIIFMVIILLLLTFLCYRCYKKREFYLLTILFSLAIHAIIDDLVFHPFFNSFWLIIGSELLQKRYRKTGGGIHAKNIVL